MPIPFRMVAFHYRVAVAGTALPCISSNSPFLRLGEQYFWRYWWLVDEVADCICCQNLHISGVRNEDVSKCRFWWSLFIYLPNGGSGVIFEVFISVCIVRGKNCYIFRLFGESEIGHVVDLYVYLHSTRCNPDEQFFFWIWCWCTIGQIDYIDGLKIDVSKCRPL